MPTRQEIIDYITQSATRRGIDPRVVLKVFQQESGLRPDAQNVTPREKSYGIAQLNLQGGLGVEARRRGIEPTDPSQWKRHVDFSLDTVKRDGWRQWMGARDTGVGRWAGVNSISDTGRTKYPSVKMGDEPTLQNLEPPKPTRNVRPEESAEASILKQSAPTEPEQVSEMARPSIKDAIRKSMDELGIKDNLQYAGFVPPGLTKGAAKTRAGANANVQPRGGLPVERDLGPDVGPYNRNAPGTRGMEGSYADYVRRQHEEMAKARGGDPNLPPGVKSATDPSGAADPRTGTAVAPYDPNLAAQNDPARQALISARIRGQARGGPTIDNGVSPRTAATVGTGGAIAAAAVDPNSDPAVEAVKQKIAGSANAAGAGPGGRVANVDPGVEVRGKQLGARPGQLSDPNTGYQTMAAGPLIGQAMPVFKEAMKDPQTAAAVKQAAGGFIRAKAKIDAQSADQRNDPTFYQQQAARTQMQPGGGGGGGDPISDRAMERAVMMDNASRTSPRGPVAATPQQQPTQGTVRNIRQTPQAVRDQDRPITNEEVMPQPVPPGAEKGDIPRTPVPPGFPIPLQTQSIPPTMRGAADPRGAEAYPIPPGAQDVTGGIQGMPSSGQMPMDPVMMQLMQFFTQGGGGGDVG